MNNIILLLALLPMSVRDNYLSFNIDIALTSLGVLSEILFSE